MAKIRVIFEMDILELSAQTMRAIEDGIQGILVDNDIKMTLFKIEKVTTKWAIEHINTGGD